MPAESLIGEIVEIADTPEFGIKKVTKADGSVEQIEADMIEHRRLRIDTRKWAGRKDGAEEIPGEIHRGREREYEPRGACSRLDGTMAWRSDAVEPAGH